MSGHHISTEGWPSVSKMVAVAQQMLQMWLFLAHPENYTIFSDLIGSTQTHVHTLTGCCFLKWHTFCWRSAWKPRVAPDLLPLDFSWGRQREVLSPLSRFSRFPSVHNKLSFWEVDTHIHTPLGFYILSCIDSPGKLDETLTERRKEISEAHRWSSVERLFFSLKKSHCCYLLEGDSKN